MKLRLVLLLLIWGVVLGVTHAHDASGVSDERFARLAKGVNITRWFWLNDDQSEKHYRNYVSDQQLQDIRVVGFTHVRLAVDPLYLLNEAEPDQINGQRLDFLDAAVARIVAHDLAVIVDIHAWEEDFKNKLMADTDFQQAYITMWQTLAANLSNTDPEMVFLEVMNEPAPDDPTIWPPLQERIAAGMRVGAPLHTIIVGGPVWNNISGLLQLDQLDDPNIVYNFHFYDPFIFTHQGASWVKDFAVFHDIPYPSTNGRCGTLPDYGDPKNEWAAWYCNNDTWDAAHIDSAVKEAVDWAAERGVRLTVNEFGVTPLVAPPADRLQWFRDVHTVFEKYGIGWTLWGYDDGLGLDYVDRGSMDESVLKALGMKVAK
ncbi:MAG: cellulase family glycosylhydrolase [Anaerolineae bacterium]